MVSAISILGVTAMFCVLGPSARTADGITNKRTRLMTAETTTINLLKCFDIPIYLDLYYCAKRKLFLIFRSSPILLFDRAFYIHLPYSVELMNFHASPPLIRSAIRLAYNLR